ncbi:MAG: energy-coupling factor ABC transporter ATP-binding protein [Alkalispirochaetaceae bacterium]
MADIRVEELRFHYTPGVEVLKGLNVTLGAGATAIIGQNGAGKSTFVRLLNGLLKPVSGRVLVDGVDTRETTVATLARRVGLVFQNPADQLFKSRVLDEVMFGPRNLGFSEEEARAHSEAALRELDLLDFADTNPYDLGLAERKLVTVAGIVAMDTEVVILDEPTIAQDMLGTERLGSLVFRLTEAGKTVLTITHDMDFVARYFERVIVMREGEIIADGAGRRVFGEEKTLQAAGLEPPQITELAKRLGSEETILTVEEFLRRYPAAPKAQP